MDVRTVMCLCASWAERDPEDDRRFVVVRIANPICPLTEHREAA